MTSQDSTPAAAPRARYWRSLSELHRSDDFKQFIDREFPVAASEFPEGVSRRRWLQLMGASLAVAGVTGCRYPEETIAPFVLRPEGRVPGETYSRATNFETRGPNLQSADHLCRRSSAQDRSPITITPAAPERTPTCKRRCLGSMTPIVPVVTTARFCVEMKTVDACQLAGICSRTYGSGLLKTAANHGNGGKFAVLMEPTSSPSVLRKLGELRKRLPKATFVRFDGINGDVMRDATKKALGKPAKQVLNLSGAKTIVAIQADILGSDRGFLQNARGFSEHRDPTVGDMSRLYVVEGGYSSTGVAADSRLALRPSEMPAFLSELSRRVDKLKGGEKHDHGTEAEAFDELSPADRLERFIDTVGSRSGGQ